MTPEEKVVAVALEDRLQATSPLRNAQMRNRLVLVSLLGLTAACIASQESSCFVDRGGPSPLPSPSPSVSPTPTPTPSPSPTPDPCAVLSVNVSADAFPAVGTIFRVDVTPVGPAGPQEGDLDRCNRNRTVTVEQATANVRCIGSCSGFVQSWQAQARGDFSIRLSVERVISSPFTGTVR